MTAGLPAGHGGRDDGVDVAVASPDDEADLHRVFRRAFPPFERVAFSTKGHVLVARSGGDVVGGAVLRAADVGGSRVGVVDWIFADPETAIPGTGAALRDAADRWFDEAGCDEHVARIEPVNTASQELHRRVGYAPLSFRGQLGRWSWRLPQAWLVTHGGIDPGLRPWVRPATMERRRLRFAGTVLLNVLLLTVVSWRAPRDLGVDLHGLVGLTAISASLLGVRELTIRLAARARGVRLNHVPWTSGSVLALGLAAAGGIWWPLTGSAVPDRGPWRYDRQLPRLAASYLAGGVAVAGMAWAAVLTPEAPAWLPLGDIQRAAVMLALFDLVLPTAPMYGTTARVVVDRSRTAWLLLAFAALGALLMSVLST